ncbi:MAG: metallophosphoesterase [Candidatus Micrarchaeia archaeon]|jgi:putative SbcD/Mre11-related phosphoesterase
MKFVSNYPVAVISKTLLCADLHLGIEFELERGGVNVGLQWPAAAKTLEALLKQTKCTQLLIIGDAKHDIRGFEEREKRMMRDFFRHLLANGAKKIVVCKGNHDGQLQELAGEGLIELVGPQGFVLESGRASYGVFHGHAWPARELMDCDWLLMGHNHPLIELSEPMGFKWSEPAWIIGSTKPNKPAGFPAQKTVVFPAFNALSGGLVFNRFSCTQLLGPIFENELFDLRNAEARLLNGVSLGRIALLRRFTEPR